jgi:ABC-type nickel/cobalt efflux system permease component RcnA
MKKWLVLLVLFGILCLFCDTAQAQNPFTSKSAEPADVAAPKMAFSSRLFTQITQWQFQIREKMTSLIRNAKETGRPNALLFLLGLAFAYGVIHAAGPGHGKVVATSYVLSHRASVLGGITFAVCIGLIHGFSGALGVMGLRFFLQQGVNKSLADTTEITQIVSFGLIFLLGLAISLKHGHGLLVGAKSEAASQVPASKKGLASWALALGLVPCPAVVMVMLFCISMEVWMLGLLMAACISLGMATTISVVVTVVVMGKGGVLKTVPQSRIHLIEGIIGVVAGTGVTVFGLLLFLASLWN